MKLIKRIMRRKNLDELKKNLEEVISMLLENNDYKPESQFIGIQNIMVA